MRSTLPHLKEVAHPVMPPIEGPRVTGEERAHAPGERAIPRPDQEVSVVREHGSAVERGPDGDGDGPQAGYEVGAVPVVADEARPLEPPHHHVVEGRGGIEASEARHGGRASSTR